jgi:hypothetical protein
VRIKVVQQGCRTCCASGELAPHSIGVDEAEGPADCRFPRGIAQVFNRKTGANGIFSLSPACCPYIIERIQPACFPAKRTVPMLRYTIALCSCLLLLPMAQADDKERKPNTLTPQEIAEGWILLFDGETTFGWKGEGAKPEAKMGVLVIGGDQQAKTTCTTAFSDGELDFESMGMGSGETRLHLNGLPVGNKLEFPIWCPHKVIIRNGSFQSMDTGGGAMGRLVSGTFLDPKKPRSSCVLGIHTQGKRMMLRNIKFKAAGFEPVFNGKDLTGWKEVANRNTKSVFTVTEKGELNIKNGPGDIHTEGEWDDFILQLDVISNGQRLNSGVFFRCVPGQFWSGYEAQIRNEWLQEVKLKDGITHVGQLTQKDDATTLRLYEQKGDRYEPAREPPVEGQRPRNKPPLKLAKADIESVRDLREQPFDFGTGGLYNRQPARKVVSSDGEYCTMTVIAHGDHIAIWVNGYQTVDFTDTAKDAASARQGRKLGKGPISLQGHDPTTDLSFKNIRIAPLAKPDK